MDLAGYLEQANLTQAEFARRMGCSQGLVYQWITRRTRITGERARQIERVTGGLVQPWELRPDLFEPPAQRRGKRNGTNRAEAV